MLQKLLEELQEKFYAEKDMQFSKERLVFCELNNQNQTVEEYEEKIRALQDRVDELEAGNKYYKEQNEKYFSVVETYKFNGKRSLKFNRLENENEKLRDENRKQQTEIALLNDKIQKMGQAMNNRSTANSSGLLNAPASPIGLQPQQVDVICN